MLGSIFSSLGGQVGKYLGSTRIGQFLGGGILSSIGRYAGRHIGNFMENKWFHNKETFHKYANLKESFTLSMASYGSPIPLIFGKTRVGGKIIWADGIKNAEETTSSSVYFPKPQFMPFLPNQKKSTTHYTDYKYFLSFAVCICEGEIQDIGRIWNGGELIDISQYKFRLYKGKKDQMPDPLIQDKMNNQAPGFRDLAYIVFEDLPLADFGDVIPNLSFEVTRKANVPNSNMLEDIVTSMIMIPGSGEYVYDTKIQSKQVIGPNNSIVADKILNSHNIYNIPDSIHSLNQLKDTCANVKWVAPVVCWFADSLNLAKCLIRPAVEFKDEYVKYSEDWLVGGYDRNTAYEITKDKNNNPRYGGSINDQSVLRYLEELRRRELKIMFYPMFFMDVEMKPWRGHLTGTPENVTNFFHKKQGYNEFILHYANLVKDHVDAFLIGTELIGLTKIKDDNNNFPAVNEFVVLAEKVKKIVGKKVLVGYAADWSEYHHTEGGWFNLDPLWASDNIDFIGIDAYFPVTNSESSFITNKDIESGFSSGECYDYYVDYKQNKKHPLEPVYALKNLQYWWENTHTNPDNKITPWQPKSKKIWFTEYGFPSINKAPNQPNVFFDPFCSDGGVPRHSNGEIDFSIQRRCIRAFIEYWGSQECVDNMFLWTWDARPYPAWPHMDIWKDGYLWEKGHWVNDKFGACSASSIILEISDRCGLRLENIDTKTIDEGVGGAIFNNQISGNDAINMLRSAYFFDISASNEQKISFIKRGLAAPILVNSDYLVKLSDNSYVSEADISPQQILSKVDIYFQNQLQDYKTNYLHFNSERFSNLKNATLRLPIVMPASEALRIANLLLQNAATENKILQFNLPISYADLEPADFISLDYDGRKYHLRVIKITFTGLIINVVAVIDNINNYHNAPASCGKLELFYQASIKLDFEILDLPFALYDYDFPYLAVCFNNNAKFPLYSKIKEDLSEDWHKIAILEPNNSIAKVINFSNFDKPNFFLIDEIGVLEVAGPNLEQWDDNKWKLAKINNEIIAFKNIKKQKNEIYEISYFIRGCCGSEKYAKDHEVNSRITIIKQPNIIPVFQELIGQEVIFKIGDLEQSLTFKNQCNLPIIPIITVNYIENSMLHLEWISRSFKVDNWSKQNKRNLIFTIKITVNDKVYDLQTNPGDTKIDINISEMGINNKEYGVEMVGA